MKKALLAGIVLSGLMVAQTIFAEVYNIDPVHSRVGFKIRHLVSKVSGEFKEFSGKINFDEASPSQLATEANIKTTSINTNNEMRDKDLRSPNFFNAEKYPEMIFKSVKVTPKGGNQYIMAGELTLLGVTKPIALNVEYGGKSKDMQGNERVGFSALGKLNRNDYGMKYNIPLDKGNFMIGEEVEIQIDIEGVKKK